ncbi:MAG: hypothetical protein M3071_02480 [Actinomycetota bacterium]|nr:hypothetical protein [Actinomycetota bacterium]
MSRLVRGCSVLSVLATCAVLAGQVVSAQASDNTIRATIISWNGRIKHDEQAVAKASRRYEHNGQTAAVIKTMTHEDRDLHRLIGRLDGESASSARGAIGKADITAGLGLIATAYGNLAHAYKLLHTATPVPRAKILATVSLDRKGRAKVRAGIRLLS